MNFFLEFNDPEVSYNYGFQNFVINYEQTKRPIEKPKTPLNSSPKYRGDESTGVFNFFFNRPLSLFKAIAKR